MKLRRLACLLLIGILLLSTGALAARRYYMEYGDSGEPIGWFQEYLGVSERYEYNYYGDTEPYFGEETRRALKAFQREWGLTASGKLDARTLYALLDLPEYSASEDPFVWIPMHGGSCYHWVYDCGGLYEPREVPMTCAEAMGFYPCKKCMAY